MIKDVINANQKVTPNQRELEALYNNFPSCFDSYGVFDVSKFLELIKNKVDIKNDGYELKFLGKNYARMLASLDTETIIVPDVDHNNLPENVNSQNIYISGDNLDGLKHLLKSYAGKINTIYIDVPYNTGKDFVYKDKFNFDVNYLVNKLSIDEKEAERILNLVNKGSMSHSAWLTFMYPRLILAKDLLKKSGVIFISVDDNEQANLKLLCDSVFGEDNFVACAPIKTGAGTSASHSDNVLRKVHDYVLIYIKSDFAKFTKLENGEKVYPYADDYGRYNLASIQATGSDATTATRPTMCYPVFITNKGEITVDFNRDDIERTIYPEKVNGEDGRWIWMPETFRERISNNLVVFQDNRLYRKVYCNEEESQIKYKIEQAWLTGYTNAKGTKDFDALFNVKKLFDHPKPIELLKFLINLSNQDNDFYVLDFFAGSSTTAQAVMDLNLSDNGNRKYIMIQIPDEIGKDKIAYKNGYKTIDEIGMDRIIRAANMYREQYPNTKVDLGFKHYTLHEVSQKTLDKMESFSDHELLTDSTVYDDFGVSTILTTWLVHDGYGFNNNCTMIDIAGYTAYWCENHLYLINPRLTEEAIKALVEKYNTEGAFNPQNIVLFGYSFNYVETEDLKTNIKILRASENGVRI